MEMPKALNEAEIEEIKAKYEKIIAEADPAAKALCQVRMNEEIAQTIARQRQDAIDAGGELGEKVKAENERMKAEAEANFAKIKPELDRIAAVWDPQIEAETDMIKKAELMGKKAEAQAEIFKTIM